MRSHLKIGSLIVKIKKNQYQKGRSNMHLAWIDLHYNLMIHEFDLRLIEVAQVSDLYRYPCEVELIKRS